MEQTNFYFQQIFETNVTDARVGLWTKPLCQHSAKALLCKVIISVLKAFDLSVSTLNWSLHINVARSSSSCLYKAVETFTDNIRPEARYKRLTKLLLQFSQSWGELRYEHSVFVSSKSYRVGAKIGFWFLLTVNGYWTDQAKGCLNIFQAGFQTPKSAQ